jgi:predicted nuclease with TOPRIM domain
MKLYELTGHYNKLQELLEDSELDAQALQDTIEGIEGEIEDKADNMARLIKNLEYNAEALKAEKNKLAQKQQAMENKIANLKAYLQLQMAAMGTEKIKGTIFTVSIQNNPPSLLVADDAEIPMKYWKQIDPVVDREALLKDVKAGAFFKGVHIQQTKGLRIR